MAYISLRAIREQKGLTIAQLAGKTSISLRTLQAYESGDRAIAPDDLRKLARVLLVTGAEILQPAEPPPAPIAPPTPVAPPPVPAVVQAAPEAPVATPNGPRVEPERGPENGRGFAPRLPSYGGSARPPFERGPERGMDRGSERGPQRPLGVPTGAPRPSAPRPARSPRVSRPVAPATSGQVDQIRNFARRLGLEDAQLAEQVGAPLESLTLPAARAAITRLRTQMEESGTWRPRVGEGPDQEGEYLARLRQSAVPVEVLLFGGERVRGLIDSFTPYVIQVRQPDGTQLTVRKLAVVYYRTLEAVDDAR